MSRGRRVKAADVAEEAGVSTATVSYVLNNTEGQKISEATTERVRSAAKRLGYVSDPFARSLARGESNFIIIDMSVFPRSETSDGAFYNFADYLEQRGYTTLLTWWGPENWEKNLVKLATDTSASRVITSIPVTEETLDALHATGVKTVSSILARPEELVLPLQRAAAEQVKHLALNGHTHMLYLAETNPELAALNALREGAGSRAAAAAGACWSTIPGSTTAEEYREHIERALAEHPEATALVAYNDHVALRALSALQAIGVAVPEAMSLIGVDDLPFADATYPPLTTVRYFYSLDTLQPEEIEAFIEGDGRNGLVADVSQAVRVEVVARDSVQQLH